ncbi:hypothetical protein HY639_05795 [Candidatus Woesearchaeota archaeon]|nr:hypothetical protein [Candidatus Woesearchaeota archaeon]
MSILIETRQALVDPLTTIWQSTTNMLPGLLAGIVILLFGYLVAKLVAYAVHKLVVKGQLDKWLFEKTNLKPVVGKFDLASFVGTLVKWYVFILFLPSAADMVQLSGLSDLLRGLALWIPNLITAVILALLGWLGAEYAAKEIVATKAKGANVIADIAWGGILVFAGLMALTQMSVAVSLAENTFLILLAGIVFATALALGLGFGLALKDEAVAQIKKLKKMF